MNLLELKKQVDFAFDFATGLEIDPSKIPVSLQIGINEGEVYTDENIEVIYDNDTNASGCVIVGYKGGV